MKPADREALLARLAADIQALARDIDQLRWDYYIYKRLSQVVSANPRLQQASRFLLWMFASYAQYACMQVRRLLDDHDGVISLATIVQRLVKHPGLITREEFVRACPGPMQRSGAADEVYDRFASPGGDTLSTEYFWTALKRARAECKKTQAFADKHIAHKDRKMADEWPKWRHLADAASAVDELFCELHLLIMRVPVAEFDPTLGDDWEWVLREPWVPAGGSSDPRGPEAEGIPEQQPPSATR